MTWRLFFWILFGAVATAALAFVFAFACAVPEPLSWRAAWGLGPVPVSWEQLTSTGDGPRLLFSRALQLAALEIPGMDFAYLPILTWLLALLCTLLVLRLTTRTLGNLHPTARPALLLLLGAWVFSPNFGSLWLFDARIRYVLPALAALLSVTALTRKTLGFWTYALALLACSLATLSERSGAVLWIAMLPIFVAEFARGKKSRAARRLAFWMLIGNAVAFACYAGTRPYRPTGILSTLLGDPLGGLHYFFGVLGKGFPLLLADSASVSRWTGAALLLFFAIAALQFIRSKDADLRRRAAPWLALAFFAVLQAIFTTHHSYPAGVADSLFKEVNWSMFLLPVGILGTWAVLSGARARLAMQIGAASLVVLLINDWRIGVPKLFVEHLIAQQEEAKLSFALNTSAGQMEKALISIPDPAQLRLAKARGLLHSIAIFESSKLADIRGSTVEKGSAGSVDSMTADSVFGRIQALEDGSLPDLIVLSQQSSEEAERILKVIPVDIFTRAPGAQWSTSFALSPEISSGQDIELRAYGFFRRGQRWARFDSIFHQTEAGWERKVPGR